MFLYISKKKIVIAISIFLLFVYTQNLSNDFLNYIQLISSIATSENLSNAIFDHRYEPTFIMLVFYLSKFFSPIVIFYSLAVLSLLIKFNLFTKYLEYPLISWLIYLIIFLPILDGNQLRGSLGAIFILYVILNRSSKVSFILNFILGSLFHYISAIILFLKFYKNPLLVIVFALLSPFFINFLLFLSNNFFYFEIYFKNDPRSVNLLTFMSLSQCLISFYTFIYWKNLELPQKKGGLLLILGLVFYFIFRDNPLLAHRIREISMLGIFPLFFLSKLKINYTTFVAIFGLLIIISYSLINIFIRIYNFSN